MQTTWSRDVAAKLPLIRAYRTQVDEPFPAGKIPVVPETYLLPKQQQEGRLWPRDDLRTVRRWPSGTESMSRSLP